MFDLLTKSILKNEYGKERKNIFFVSDNMKE